MNLQACIGKQLPSRCGRTKSNYRKEKDLSRGRNLDYDSWMTHVEKTLFEILIVIYVYFRHLFFVTVKKREQRIGMLYFQYWERRVYKIPKLIGKRIHVWGLVALPVPQKLQIGRYSCNPKTMSGSPPRMMNDAKIPYKSTIRSPPWIEHEINTPLQKQEWEQKRNNAKSCTEVYTLVQKEDKHFLYNGRVYNLFRQQCKRSRSNYRYKEIEEGESSKSLSKDAKCKVLNLLVRNAETNFGRQKVQAIITYQSLRWKNAL